MCKKIEKYFSDRIYEKHLFRLIGFSSKEYATIKIIAYSKKQNAKVWYFNNFFFPLCIVYIPYTATIIHNHFQTVPFSKTLLELTITGSLSLVGLNVLRSASTYISEKLDESKIPNQFSNNIDLLKSELSAIKGNLKTFVFALTVIGTLLYIIQAIQLINGTNNVIYYFISVIGLVTFLSILVGRFIYLMETNFFDNEDVVILLFQVVNNQKNEFESLKNQINKIGLQ